MDVFEIDNVIDVLSGPTVPTPVNRRRLVSDSVTSGPGGREFDMDPEDDGSTGQIVEGTTDGRRGAKRPATSPLQNQVTKRSIQLTNEDILAIKEDLASHDQNFAVINAGSKDNG